MKIDHVITEQDWANETTRYWFLVDGEGYCIADQNGDFTLLDSEGYPIDECNDFGRVKGVLVPLVEKMVDPHQ